MNQENQIKEILENRFHLSEFRGSQKEIIDHILAGGNALVLMPTGMGKSLCYQLPALIFNGLTVVVSPLISLMKDQVDQLLDLNIDATFINSSLGKNEREKRYRNVADGRYKLLYISPERFRNKRFLEVMGEREISLLVLDEAHCVSQWGNDFRPDYSRIREFRNILGNPQTIALTATATEHVQQDILEKTEIPREQIRIFNDGICRPNLYLAVHESLDAQEKFDLVYEQIKRSDGNTIVYFNLISGIEKFAEFLDLRRVRYSIYHGKLEPTIRRKTQQRFMGGNNMLMLATNAFGMGVDKSDIRMIVHAEIPDSIESYYQEIGRAGRDGKRSECILIYCQDDLAVQMNFLEWRNPDAGFLRNAFVLLKSLSHSVNSYLYEDIQEKLVHKNRSDHRLQTVFNLFDLHHVTEGSLEAGNLKVVSDPPEFLLEENLIKEKFNHDRLRLVAMLKYAKSSDCRRSLIHEYFSMKDADCNNCDNCERIDRNCLD